MERRASRDLQDVLIGGRFRVQQRVGGGAFGEVFMGRDVETGTPVAFKMELLDGGKRSHLSMENKVYRRLNECTVTVGIPQTYFCGTMGEYVVMVMDLLGPSLEELFNLCNRHFSVKTVCMLGAQIIERLQYVHRVGYLHRDIKPENFVMGLGDNSHVVYMIDVGLAKPWRLGTGQHVPYSENRTLTGTARYVSINCHRGIQQARRDDLESVSYLLIYFLRGSLPWQGLRFPKSDTRYEHICKVKVESSPAALAAGFPSQFGRFVEYAQGLQFDQEPDYESCVRLLAEVMHEAHESFDFRYEWNCGLHGREPMILEGTRNTNVSIPDSLLPEECSSGNSKRCLGTAVDSRFLTGSHDDA